jgi:hypothetical protein
MVAIAFIIAIGAMAGQTASAATPSVGLGTAGNFSILAGTPDITNTGPTTVNKDLGIHPATAVNGFPPGIVAGTIHAGDSVAAQAKADLVSSYLNAAARPVTATHTALGGLTLVDGVYNAGGATLGLTGTLTLDGQNDPSSVWIFQATSDLVTASASQVLLTRGASACNVFWQVTSSATLGSNSTFVGTIMALTSITLASGVVVDGRTLARNGTVTLINDTFISSPCQAVITPPTQPPFTIAPSATPTPVPSAIATFTPGPVAAASPTLAPTAAPVAAAAPTTTPVAAAIASTQSLPSTSTSDPIWPARILGIALTLAGALLLFRRPIRL